MFKTQFVFILCLLILTNTSVFAEDNTQDKQTIDIEYELDPYYTNIGLYYSLDDKPIPEIDDEKEENLYRRLLSSTLLPQFMLIEASINPLPILGVYIKKNHPEFYDDSEVFGNVNLVQAITEGFEEPYALSLFFGSVVQYTRTGIKTKSKNKGYMGYLFSVGDQHIRNNELVDDQWYELEWKIKGDLDFDNRILSWSFRIGGKNHDHSEIADVVYISLRRNHFNSIINGWSWINNSDMEYRMELDNTTGDLVQQQIIFTKKWALHPDDKKALSFGLGVVQEKNKYTGSLAVDQEEYRLIIRSNFQF